MKMKNLTHPACSSRMLRRLPLIALLLIMTLSALPCAAASRDKAETVKWTLSGDESSLTGNGKTYTLYNMIPGWEISPSGIYVYNQTFRLDGQSVQIMTSLDSGEFVWLFDSGDEVSMYVTAEGKRMLDALAAGETSSLWLENSSDDRAAILSDALIGRMDAPGAHDMRNVPVSSLAFLTRYDICGYDATGTVRTVCGAVYKTSEGWLYVDYRPLGNQYFDADGHFSYRTGEVTGSLLNQDVCRDLVELADNMPIRNVTYTYELLDDIEDPDFSDDTSIALFWVSFILLGYLVPIAPLVVGLVMPHSAKQGYPKRWYLLSMLAVIWIAIAIGITVVLTI